MLSLHYRINWVHWDCKISLTFLGTFPSQQSVELPRTVCTSMRGKRGQELKEPKRAYLGFQGFVHEVHRVAQGPCCINGVFKFGPVRFQPGVLIRLRAPLRFVDLKCM